MISVQEAKAILTKNCPQGTPIKIDLFDSVNFINARDINSPILVPSFDNSAMDGYAFAWKDREFISQASCSIAAGNQRDFELPKNSACRIFTGAPMPKGADTVIPQEFVTCTEESIFFDLEKIHEGANVRKKGTQSVPGQRVLNKGTLISPGTIGLLTSLGIASVEVFPPPTVGVIITGNELKEVGTPILPGEIYNTNGPIIYSYLKKLGIQTIEVFNVADDPESILKTIEQATSKHDFTITSGGISVGDYDYVRKSLDELGVQELFYKVNHRPGKPIYAGIKNDHLVFGLPGNPASVISCFLQYVKPSILQCMGHLEPWKPSAYVELENSFFVKKHLTYFLKAKRNENKVTILPGQESFNLNPFGEANCMIEIPEGCLDCKKGDLVAIHEW